MIAYLIFLGIFEVFLAYVVYHAISHEIPSAEELHEKYILSCGLVRIENDKKSIKEADKFIRSKARLLKNENGTFIISEDAFLSQIKLKHDKFFSIIVAIGFILFLFPLLPNPENENHSGFAIFFLIGGAALTTLAEYAIRKTDKKIENVKKEFFSLFSHKYPICRWNKLSQETISKISLLVKDDYYKNAPNWMTDYEKSIWNSKEHNDNFFKYCRLCDIVEHGYQLDTPDRYTRMHPLFGERTLKDKNPNQTPTK